MKKIKDLMSIFGAIIGVIYLINPTAGIIEIIPDNIPYIGNLDEVGAVLLILACLRRFNIDIFKSLSKKD